MYEPLRSFIKKERKCDPVWAVGDGTRIRLRVPSPNKRIPDVVGARRIGANHWETHVIEAKPRQGGGAAVPQALGQLRAISAWADYLYLALERADWDARSGPQRRHLEAELSKDGYGLLLVDDEGSITVPIEPQRNRAADAAKRDELLLLLQVQVERANPFAARLGTTGASAAAACVSATLDCLALIQTEWFSRLGGKDRSGSYGLYWDSDGDLPYTIITTKLKIPRPRIYVEGDPFGAYLKDAEPRVWLWRSVTALAPLVTAPTLPALRGWSVYASTKEEDEWRASRIEDADLEHWNAEGITHDCHIGYPLTFLGRRPEGVRREFVLAMDAARLKEGRFLTKYSSGRSLRRL